ncbi:hypothetical protein [Herbidospora daliensis]|uniref:hypothetical protein n=1 Tax=Herbidospora daliensis TaxID=295585 RepID=UPI0007852A61|nr:hypothetical protein [Herbidospora daliensis]
MSSAWESALTHAFGQLLGRPLADHDPTATYGAFYGGNWLYETGLDRHPGWVRREALSGQETVRHPEVLILLDGYADLVFDASESLFEVDPAEFADGLVASVSVFAKPGIVRGRDLAMLLDGHPGEPGWQLWQARIASDGTLLGALRAATAVGDSPQSLIPPSEEPDERAVLAHLEAFSDTTSDDLAYCPQALNEAVVAMWEGAVDQYEITIWNLDQLTAQRATT